MEDLAGGVVALEDFHRNGALAGGGEEFGGVEEVGGERVSCFGGERAVRFVAEADESGFGENGAVEFGLVDDFLESGGDVAADVDDLEVGTEMEELQFAADGGGADGGSLGQVCEGGALRDQDVAGGGAGEDGADFELGLENGGDVFEGVNREINFAV